VPGLLHQSLGQLTYLVVAGGLLGSPLASYSPAHRFPAAQPSSSGPRALKVRDFLAARAAALRSTSSPKPRQVPQRSAALVACHGRDAER
jgi:hypothetical protein